MQSKSGVKYGWWRKPAQANGLFLEGQIGSLVPPGRTMLLMVQLSFLGLRIKCKQGYSGTKLQHFLGTRKSLFGESNIQAISQGTQNSGQQGKTCQF